MDRELQEELAITDALYKQDELDVEFDDQAMKAMKDLGLPEDEAEMMLEDYKLGY